MWDGGTTTDEVLHRDQPPQQERPQSSRGFWRSRRVRVACCLLTLFCVAYSLVGFKGVPARVRTLAEFELSDQLALAWHPGLAIKQWDTLGDIVRHSDQAKVLILVPDQQHQDAVEGYLRRSGVAPDRLQFSHDQFDRVWLRDFGPRSVQFDDNQFGLVTYGNQILGGRAWVRSLADRQTMRHRTTKLKFEGGNFITDGRGTLFTTTRFSEQNHNFPGDLEQELRVVFGIERVVVLEPLPNEPTRHVDMFLMMTDAQTVVLAEMRDDRLPDRGESLARNAQLISRAMADQPGFRLVRVPMPPPREGWATYTNCVFAGRSLLIPSYSWVDRSLEAEVEAIYRDLLPRHKITFIEADSLSAQYGSLHCATLNLITGTRPSQP